MITHVPSSTCSPLNFSDHIKVRILPSKSFLGAPSQHFCIPLKPPAYPLHFLMTKILKWLLTRGSLYTNMSHKRSPDHPRQVSFSYTLLSLLKNLLISPAFKIFPRLKCLILPVCLSHIHICACHVYKFI